MSRSGTTITYRAAPGEKNHLTVDTADDGIGFYESVAPPAGGLPTFDVTGTKAGSFTSDAALTSDQSRAPIVSQAFTIRK